MSVPAFADGGTGGVRTGPRVRHARHEISLWPECRPGIEPRQPPRQEATWESNTLRRPPSRKPHPTAPQSKRVEPPDAERLETLARLCSFFFRDSIKRAPAWTNGAHKPRSLAAVRDMEAQRSHRGAWMSARGRGWRRSHPTQRPAPIPRSLIALWWARSRGASAVSTGTGREATPGSRPRPVGAGLGDESWSVRRAGSALGR